MNKVFHPEFDQAELIKAAGKIVTLVDGSSNQRIKSAASSAVSEQLIRENLPDDNHFAVHLIALGDGEEYGPNRNNDYFSKRANKKYHPTFVSHGHFFREHNNRDPKNAIGIVKASAHNADMSRVELIIHGDKKKAEEEYELLKKDASLSFSMSCKIATDVCNCCGNKAANRSQYCFVSGTKITLSDGTIKNIEDILVGDKVLDMSGKATEVVSVGNREVDEELVSFSTTMFGKAYTTCCTKEHPIWSLPSELTTLSNVSFNYKVNKLNNRPGFTQIPDLWNFNDAGNLRNSDIVQVPILQKNPEIWDNFCDEEDAWVYGLFIAEGSYAKQNGKRRSIQFSLHQDETDFIKRIDAWKIKLGIKSKLCVYPHKGSKGVSVCINNHELAQKIFSVCGEYAHDKKLDVRFLHAPENIQISLLKGIFDGDGHDYMKCGKYISSRLNSASENLLWQVAQICAQLGHLFYVSRALNVGGPTNRSNIRSIFYLNTTVFALEDTMMYSKRGFSSKYPAIECLIEKQSFFKFKGLVYNIETTSHTYIANGIAVHNCDHMKHHAGEYMPEFKKFAYVDNPDPVFFDISRVKSPADRIAHYLEYVDGALSKAAHEHKPILGAELADLEGVNLPHSPDEYFNQQERKILQKLAFNEAYLENVFKGADVPRDNKYNFTKYALTMMVPRDTADKSIVEGLCAHDLPILMRKLATARVILPFKSFYSMINGEDPETLDFDPTYKHACAAVPNTFRSLEDGSNKVLQVGFTSSYFDPVCDQVDACNTDEFEKAMDYFIHKFSLRQLEEPTVQIIQVSAQPSLSEDFKMKEASVVDKNKSEIAVGLYGLYKLSCCKQLASELDDPKYLTITYLK